VPGEFKLSSPGLRSTKYDNGGGGARGPYSSTFADRLRVPNATSGLCPLIMRQIFARPPFTFWDLSCGFS
jgi:hypothetical protein